VRPELPSGSVTFLFTDVEGSTRLLHGLGAERYAKALAEHRRVIRAACSRYDGVEVDTQGDAFFFAFATAPAALAAATESTDVLASGLIQVRIGLHTGTPLLTDEGYVGDDVHFGARVAASAHGGQIVLSKATQELLDERFPLIDLGEHRLKDIAQAVSIFQLGDGSFPPLKTISNTNLPRPASSFVGRESELAEVLARVEAGARLVSLTGPGGSGKTRLALEAAASLVSEYKAGVFWVGLAALRDPALVTETISQTLGAKDGLAEHVGEREMFLLLDNLEQVIEAASELSSLLKSCPNLTLLVTSRELLRVQGEVEYPVPPLAEPEAVALFCERAQVKPSEEIAELCARLDSLPLAVELAAARAKALSPAQILARLSSRLDLLKGGRDADPRQLTLRATIEWSYDLLSEGEQRLFARLSVFARGCTLEAAEEVADADLDTLQSLVEKSLLRFTNERYWMLETIREYAAERLEESGQMEALRRRHAEFVLELAVSANLGADAGGEQRHDLIIPEQDNVRAALSWARDTERIEFGLGLAAALENFWITSDPREGMRWFDSLLGVGVEVSPRLRLRALLAFASSSYIVDEEQAARQHREALALAQEQGDAGAAATILHRFANTAYEHGDLEEARRLVCESRELNRNAGSRKLEAQNLSVLGLIARRAGDPELARELLNESLAVSRETGFVWWEADTLGELALLEWEAGRPAEAETHGREALECFHRIRDRRGMVVSLAVLARVAHSCERPRRAGVLWGAVEAEEARSPLAWALDRGGWEAGLAADAPAPFEQGRAAGGALKLDEAVDYALASID